MYISDRSLILKFFYKLREKMTNELTHKNDKERRERNSNKKYNKEQQSNNKKKYKIYLQCIFCFCYRFIEGRSTRTAGLSQGGPT